MRALYAGAAKKAMERRSPEGDDDLECCGLFVAAAATVDAACDISGVFDACSSSSPLYLAGGSGKLTRCMVETNTPALQSASRSPTFITMLAPPLPTGCQRPIGRVKEKVNGDADHTEVELGLSLTCSSTLDLQAPSLQTRLVHQQQGEQTDVGVSGDAALTLPMCLL